jgi:hypothetical protein
MRGMKRTWLWMHYGSVLIAIGLIVFQLILPIGGSHTSTNRDASETPFLIQLAAYSFIYSFISGIFLMVRRKGESESVLLAVSTLTPFVLLIVLALYSWFSQR